MRSPRRTELPQTVEECHQLIWELYDIIDALLARVAKLERQLYGTRRERFIADESELGDEDPSARDSPYGNPPSADESTLALDGSLAESSTPSDNRPSDGPAPEEPASPSTVEFQPTSVKSKRTSSGRRARAYPSDAPRVRVYHPLDESTIPADVLYHPRARRFYRFVREEVDLPRRQIRILEHYQEVIAADDLREVSSTMIAAPVPEPLIDRCFAGNSLLAYLAVSRFADHLPYYREEDIIRRSGIFIARSTQWRWMRSLGSLLLPLVDLMRRRLLVCHVLGIDETPCPILDPTLPRTRKAYLYAQYGDEGQPYVGYYFADHKTRANIETMLAGFQGVLQSDAYICYELITAASLDKIQPAACWAHGRRKFEPLLVKGKHPQASWVLREIQQLYDVEDRARAMSNDDRQALRQRESGTIVERIHAWLLDRDAHERPRAALRQGVNYFLKRWTAFTRFLDDGAIYLDNNRTESVIKGPVMGKKAWLFLGNARGGETAAVMYTLIMSCKRHCIDPLAYLNDVLDRIKTAGPDELEAMLPDRWIESHPDARMKERVQESHAAADRKRVRRAIRRQQLVKH